MAEMPKYVPPGFSIQTEKKCVLTLIKIILFSIIDVQSYSLCFPTKQYLTK